METTLKVTKIAKNVEGGKDIKYTLTLESLSGFSVNDAIEYAKTFYLDYPKKPSKPILTGEHNSRDAIEYAKNYKKYEKELVEYGKLKALYNEQYNSVNEIIESFIKEESGFNKLPETSKSKVWSKAWSDGHSNGYSEVYYHLVELVDLFN